MSASEENSAATTRERWTLTVIRHGQTTANAMGVIQGQDDSPLTEKGKLSSLAKADKLAQFRFVRVYCSDLPRARATLEIVRGRLPGLPEPVYTSQLREIDFGRYTGARKDQIMETILKHKSDTSLKYPEGESGDDLAARVDGFIHNLLESPSGGDVLVVTHYGVMETMARRYGGFPAGEPFTLGEESVALLEFGKEGTGRMEIL